GSKATVYIMDGKPNGRMIKGHEYGIKAANFIVSDEISAPTKLAQLLSAAYGLPECPAVPLKVIYDSTHHTNQVGLHTYRIQRSAIPISYFVAPQGYKLASSDAEVMINDEQRAIIDDMASQLGSNDAGKGVLNGQALNAQTLSDLKVSKDDVSKLMEMFN